MKLTIEREKLIHALERAAQATAPTGKAVNPMHSLVRLNAMLADGDYPAVLQLSATTGGIAIETAVDATVQIAGDMGVDCRRLLQSARMMPEGALLTLEQGDQVDSMLSVRAGRRQHRMPVTLDAVSRPQIPQPPEDARTLTITRSTLRHHLQRLQYACPGPDAMPRDGVIVHHHGDGKLSLSVVGNHHLALATVISDGVGDWEKALVPSGVFQALFELCEPGEEEIAISYCPSFIYCRTDETLVAAAMPANVYLDYDRWFSQLDAELIARADVKALQASLRAVLIDTQSGLHLNFQRSGELALLIENDDLGNAEDYLQVDELRAVFGCLINSKYLSDVLRSCEGTKVELQRVRNGIVVNDLAGLQAVVGLMRDERYDYDSPLERINSDDSDLTSDKPTDPDAKEGPRKRKAKRRPTARKTKGQDSSPANASDKPSLPETEQGV